MLTSFVIICVIRDKVHTNIFLILLPGLLIKQCAFVAEGLGYVTKPEKFAHIVDYPS